MPQPELGPQRPNAFITLLVPLITIIYLNRPIIIRVPVESFKAIGGHFVLEILFGDWRTEIVRVETFLSGDMFEAEFHPGRYVLEWGVGPVEFGHAFFGDVCETEIVVGISVRVEGDLLFWITLQVIERLTRMIYARLLPVG